MIFINVPFFKLVQENVINLSKVSQNKYVLEVV